MQTDLVQNFFKDPRIIAAIAAVVIVFAILLVLLVKRSAKRRREDRQLLDSELAAKQKGAQFQAAVDGIPYSHDAGEAARAVAGIFAQFQQVRVVAIYVGRQGSPKLINVLTQSASGTGSLARPIMPASVEARFASYDRPRLVQRGELIDASSPAPKRNPQGSDAATGRETMPAAASQPQTTPRAPVSPVGPVSVPGLAAAAAPGGSESAGPAQGATTSPLDAGNRQAVPATPGPPQSSGTGPLSATSAQGPPRGTGSLVNRSATGPLGAANTAAAVQPVGPSPSPDSKPVGILPWQGLFGWRGLLVIESREAMDLEQLALVLRSHDDLTSRISVALEMQRAIDAAGSATEQSSRLVEFLSSAMHGIAAQPAMTETLEQIARLMSSDSAAFWDVDAETGILRMVAAYGLNPGDFLPVPRGQGLSGCVAESRQPLAIEDAPADPKCLFPAEARDSGIGSYLGVPVLENDKVGGILEVHTRKPQPWSQASVSALRSAGIALSAINRGVQPQAPQPKPESGLKAETAYMGMSQTLESLGSRGEIVEAVVGVLGHALGVSRVIAVEKSSQTGYLNAAVVTHEYRRSDVPTTLGAMMPEELAPLFEGEGAHGPVIVNDSASGSPIPRQTVTRLHICSDLLLSLRTNETVVALIDIQQCDQPREWTRDEVEFAEKLAHQASVAITHIEALGSASRELEAARAEARRASDVATRARGIVDSVPEAIIGLDRDGRLTFFNAPGRVRYKLRNEDLGRMVGMVESLTLSEESIWEKVNSSHGIVRLEATIAAPRKAAPLAAPDRRSAQERSAISLPISIAVAPIRNEKDEITGRIIVLTDLSHTRSHSKKDTGEHVAALEAKMKETEQALSEAHKVIEQAAAGDDAGGQVAYVTGEIEKVRTDEARARRAAQQLLEINRLKSDFIVNAGRELDASLQSVLGFAELLGQGQYGQLAPEQLEAVKGIYAWARRMKNDLDWLIEYGSTRSRVLESGAEEAAPEDVPLSE